MTVTVRVTGMEGAAGLPSFFRSLFFCPDLLRGAENKAPPKGVSICRSPTKPTPKPPTIRFSTTADPQFRVMITPIWQAKTDKPLPEGAAVRELVQKSADQVQSQASNKIEIKELKGGPGAGYYFLAIDPAPKPGEWKFMTEGVLRLDDLRVTFTILTNDGQDAVVSAALEWLKGATCIHPPKK